MLSCCFWEVCIKDQETSSALKYTPTGGYLLSRVSSIIGVAKFNDLVRNGKGWDLSAITTIYLFLIHNAYL